MKTFLVLAILFWADVTSDFAAMIAGVSTSRGAFVSRGDIAGSIICWRDYRRGEGFGQAVVDSGRRV